MMLSAGSLFPAFHQSFHRFEADLVGRHPHAGEGRMGVGGKRYVVETGYADVAGNTEPHAAGFGEGPQSQHVRAAEHGAGRVTI